MNRASRKEWFVVFYLARPCEFFKIVVLKSELGQEGQLLLGG